jgi:hypothetical protein
MDSIIKDFFSPNSISQGNKMKGKISEDIDINLLRKNMPKKIKNGEGMQEAPSPSYLMKCIPWVSKHRILII